MKIEIKIPSMGESVVEATIGSFLKQEGATVKAEEELLEIETDKVNQVLYAPVAGQVHYSVKIGDAVKVGQTIGYVETSASLGAAPAPAEKLKAETAAKSEPKKETPASSEIPPARKKIDSALEEMSLSQPPTKDAFPAPPNHPVKDAFPGTPSGSALPPMPPMRTSSPAAPQAREVGRETRKKMTKLRRVIAERLVEVKNQTAMLTTFNEVDMSAVMAVREKEQENFQKKHGVKLGFMSFFVKACVAALQEFPDVNARIDKDEIVYHNFFHISVAVSTEKGLMVPVIRDADLHSYAEIEKKLKEFAEKARNGTISVDDMQGGTFTITNGGVFGSLLSTPILNPPQSGILGMHNIVKRPIAVNDQAVIRPMMYLALSYDHRIVDGKDSIQFLMHIKKSLEEPARLLLEL